MTDDPDSANVPREWPEPEPEQVRVMVLGTTHFDNPGLDEANPEVDDVLVPGRQAELADLVERLARWEPERVAVERPYDRAEDVNAYYELFRSEAHSYDDRDATPDRDFRAYDSEAAGEIHSEVVQIGFRLADELGHEQVYPIDYPMDISNDDIQALDERDFQPEAKVDVSLPDWELRERETEQRFAGSSIPGFLAWLNREELLRGNHDGMFADGLRWGEGDNFGGPRMLATWYDRNLRMVHNLWRTVESGDERVLLVVGSGHVRVLRHLLDESPMFCPVSPLPYLPANAG